MYILIIVLIVVGILGIFLELLMPGWDSYVVFGMGLLALVAAAVLAMVSSVSTFFVIAIGLALVVFGGVTLYVILRKKQLDSGLMLTDVDEAPQVDVSGFMGKEGKAVTLLRPVGEVDFNGVRIQATSGGPYIEVGQKVRVTQAQANKVVVSAVEGN